MISALISNPFGSLDLKKVRQNLNFVDQIIIISDIVNEEKINKNEFKDIVILSSRSIDEALLKVKNKWVLLCCSDDVFSGELKDKLKEITQDTRNPMYAIKRKFFFMGKEIKKGSYLTEKECLFFEKNIWVETRAKKYLNEFYVYKTYEGFDKYNNSVSLESIEKAKKLFEINLRPNLYHLLLKPYARFLDKYILKFGFLDGKEGFILAYLSAFGIFKKYIYLWTLYRNIN